MSIHGRCSQVSPLTKFTDKTDISSIDRLPFPSWTSRDTPTATSSLRHKRGQGGACFPQLSRRPTILSLWRKDIDDTVILGRRSGNTTRTDQYSSTASDDSPVRPATPRGARPRKNDSPCQWLRSSKSMFHLSGSPSNFDGPESSPLSSRRSASRTPSTARGFVPNSPPTAQPFLLVPRIIVTPESKTLDDAATTLWAAIQVSTQICRADVSNRDAVADMGLAASAIGPSSSGEFFHPRETFIC